MGMAHALYEATEPYYPNPEHRAGGFFEYILPLAPDVPEMETRVLEYPSVDGPYGVKGFGEMTANAPIPAIVNAVNNALGTEISCHPVTPEVVLRALEEKAKQPA
jgi:CO/xanthine dehydrogenase Mo-binding subunit